MGNQYEADQHVINRMMTAQSHYDWQTLGQILADDAVFEMPFINEKFCGNQEIIARWRPSLERMDGLRFHDLVLQPMAEPGWYVGTFRNTCWVRTTGLPYDQMYIGMFHVVDEKVVYFAEYFDTIRLGLALRRIEKIS